MIEESDLLAIRMTIIREEERRINNEQPVYLMTWSPDPAELPNADVNIQHKYNINFLADYLKSCACGLLCVEINQKGSPHYHGWYQIDEDKTVIRSAHIKTIQRFGLLKITKCRKFKTNVYSEKGNGLYYYKKEVGSYLSMSDAVITKDSMDDTNWNNSLFFTQEIKDRLIADKISDRKYYLQFYADST